MDGWMESDVCEHMGSEMVPCAAARLDLTLSKNLNILVVTASI